MSERQDSHSPGGARPGDDLFSSAAGRMLRDSADGIDAATAARLNRGRQAALDQWQERRNWRPWLVAAASSAAVVALAAGLWLIQGTAPTGPEPFTSDVDSAAEMDLLLAADSMEMFEDLDFYAWLDAEVSPDELNAELESET